MTILSQTCCNICGQAAMWLDVVDFNKSCEEANGVFQGLSGYPVYYALCPHCGHCFCPEICGWEKKKFQEMIYNEEYIKVDPDYLTIRPEGNVKFLSQLFHCFPSDARHLDYGGGNGILSKQLKEQFQWNSQSYDPFMDDECPSGKFDLITSFEVFEHVPNPIYLIDEIHRLLNKEGIVICSTLLNDGEISSNKRLDWWYASPRNGHINLYSKKSLSAIAGMKGMGVASSGPNLHMLFSGKIPPWGPQLGQGQGQG